MHFLSRAELKWFRSSAKRLRPVASSATQQVYQRSAHRPHCLSRFAACQRRRIREALSRCPGAACFQDVSSGCSFAIRIHLRRQQPHQQSVLCRTFTKTGAVFTQPGHPFVAHPNAVYTSRPLICRSTPTWDQADASWLDNLYGIGQQADQLVQQQLAGDCSVLVPLFDTVLALEQPAVLQV